MQEIGSKEREWLIENFSRELSELRDLTRRPSDLADPVENDLIVGKGDEGDIAAKTSQISMSTALRGRRNVRIHKLTVMLEVLPTWDFCCTICEDPLELNRVSSSASMLCVSCQEGIDIDAKRNGGGYHNA